MTKAEKESILAWMDKQIELHDGLEEVKHWDGGITAAPSVYDRRIHILDGLDKIAKAVGTEIMYRKESLYAFECFYVNYKLYTFFTTPED